MQQNAESLKVRYQRKLERLRPLVPMPNHIFERLLHCKRVFSLMLPVPVHTGETQYLPAYIAHHCNPYDTGEDPYKGGLRKSADVNQEIIEGLAMDMTDKLGVADLNLGGGKAGIRLQNGFAYTEKDHAHMNKSFVTEADKVGAIGPRVYSTASDLGTKESDMDTIKTEYIALHERDLGSKGGVATGKSVPCGGNPARKKATGRGGLIVAQKLLKLFGTRKKNMTVVIDGFGNVGQPCFELASDYGFKPIALCDVNGGIYNPHGLNNTADIIAHHKTHGTFAGYKEADEITAQEILNLSCDMLIPASIQNRITAVTAPLVRASYILELANGPVTEEGEQILKDKNIVVFPDILANAGGVIVSWRELNMNKEHDRHHVELKDEEEATNKMLADVMLYNAVLVKEISEEKTISLRDAASYLSLSRIIPRLQNKHSLLI